MRAMEEYGALNKTIFILKYLQNPEHQRRTARQLNKGEMLHSLRNCLFVANERHIRKRQQEEQLNQAVCLNLVTNAVILWNTIYIQAVLEELKVEGYKYSEEDLKHISPAGSAHINVYGRYYFNIEENMQRKGLRELRKPEEEIWDEIRKLVA